jgi:hypothetical protein
MQSRQNDSFTVVFLADIDTAHKNQAVRQTTDTQGIKGHTN